MNTIHVIGNSHASLFTGTDNLLQPQNHSHGFDNTGVFKSYSIGAVLGYSYMNKHIAPTVSVLENNYKEGDKVIIVAGEVDCRWHLPKLIEELPHINHIGEAVDRYFIALEYLHNKGFDQIAYGVHGQTPSGHCNDPASPVYGPMMQRNQISVLWNIALSDKCKAVGIPFFSIFKQTAPGLVTDGSCYVDYCHLDSKCLSYVFNQLEKINDEEINRILLQRV